MVYQGTAGYLKLSVPLLLQLSLLLLDLCDDRHNPLFEPSLPLVLISAQEKKDARDHSEQRDVRPECHTTTAIRTTVSIVMRATNSPQRRRSTQA